MLSNKQYWDMYKNVRHHHCKSLTDDFKNQMDDIAQQTVQDCIDIAHQLLNEYLKGRKLKIKKMRFDWNPGRTNSRGGRNGITICMRRSTIPFDMIEYDRFNKDPEIGYICTTDSTVHLKGTIAHEMAHFVQYSIQRFVIEDRKNTKRRFSDAEYRQWVKQMKPHGWEFQRIYRLFRNELVNKSI